MFLANTVYAADNAKQLLQNITAHIVNPIITLFFALALAVFVFGIFEFIKGADSDDVRSKGKQHMIWGIVGLFIMTATFAIIQILINLLGDTVGQPDIWILPGS
jgi:hypothetical protein